MQALGILVLVQPNRSSFRKDIVKYCVSQCLKESTAKKALYYDKSDSKIQLKRVIVCC